MHSLASWPAYVSALLPEGRYLFSRCYFVSRLWYNIEWFHNYAFTIFVLYRFFILKVLCSKWSLFIDSLCHDFSRFYWTWSVGYWCSALWWRSFHMSLVMTHHQSDSRKRTLNFWYNLGKCTSVFEIPSLSNFYCNFMSTVNVSTSFMHVSFYVVNMKMKKIVDINDILLMWPRICLVA